MRKIEFANRYKRDVRRVTGGISPAALDAALMPVVLDLATDTPLAERHRDHALTGNWKGFRECHIKPDLLLIYQKPDDKTLWLARLGSHSELKFS